MNCTIWKYPLGIHDRQVIQIPLGSEILCVQMQAGQPCLWAVVNPDAQLHDTTIQIVGTGHQVPDDVPLIGYIGTFQMAAGALVWHVFEIPGA